MTTDLKPFAAIPGPPSRFLVGELPTLKSKTPWGACAAYNADFGELTRIKILGRNALVVNGPKLIAEVLDHRQADYYKDRPRAALLPIGTDYSVFNSPGGAHWQALRSGSPLSHATFGAWLATQGPVMQRELRVGFASLAKRGTSENVWEDSLRIAFDVMSVVLTGERLSDEVYAAFRVLADEGTRRMGWPLPIQPRFPGKAKRAREVWMAAFRAAVAGTKENSSLLAFMMKDGTQRTPEQSALELANAYFGGCISSTTGVVVALKLLSEHAAERAKVVAALGGVAKDANGVFALRDLHGCAPLEYALRESLRVFPAVAIFARSVLKERDTELGGYAVPAGTTVLMSPWSVHRSPREWERPEAFEPSRWGNGVAESNPWGSDKFFPFGRGPRSCIGQAMAAAYMKLAIATAITEFDASVGLSQDLQQVTYFAVLAPLGLKATFRLA